MGGTTGGTSGFFVLLQNRYPRRPTIKRATTIPPKSRLLFDDEVGVVVTPAVDSDVSVVLEAPVVDVVVVVVEVGGVVGVLVVGAVEVVVVVDDVVVLVVDSVVWMVPDSTPLDPPPEHSILGEDAAGTLQNSQYPAPGNGAT